jgi:NADPH-dependent ferric siderophore reductase
MTMPWHEIALATADELQRMFDGVDLDDDYETTWLARQAEMLDHLARAATEEHSCPPGQYTELIEYAAKVQDYVRSVQRHTTD